MGRNSGCATRECSIRGLASAATQIVDLQVLAPVVQDERTKELPVASSQPGNSLIPVIELDVSFPDRGFRHGASD